MLFITSGYFIKNLFNKEALDEYFENREEVLRQGGDPSDRTELRVQLNWNAKVRRNVPRRYLITEGSNSQQIHGLRGGV